MRKWVIAYVSIGLCAFLSLGMGLAISADFSSTEEKAEEGLPLSPGVKELQRMGVTREAAREVVDYGAVQSAIADITGRLNNVDPKMKPANPRELRIIIDELIMTSLSTGLSDFVSHSEGNLPSTYKTDSLQTLLNSFTHCSAPSSAMAYTAITLLTRDRKKTGITREDPQTKAKRLFDEYRQVLPAQSGIETLFRNNVVAFIPLFDKQFYDTNERYLLGVHWHSSSRFKPILEVSEREIAPDDKPKLNMMTNLIIPEVQELTGQKPTKGTVQYLLAVDKASDSDQLTINLAAEGKAISPEAQQQFCLDTLRSIDYKDFTDDLSVNLDLPHAVSDDNFRELLERSQKMKHQYLVFRYPENSDKKGFRIHRFSAVTPYFAIAQKLEPTRFWGDWKDSNPAYVDLQRRGLNQMIMDDSPEDMMKYVMRTIQGYRNVVADPFNFLFVVKYEEYEKAKVEDKEKVAKIEMAVKQNYIWYHLKHYKARGLSLQDLDYIVDIYTLQNPDLPLSWQEMRGSVASLWDSITTG